MSKAQKKRTVLSGPLLITDTFSRSQLKISSRKDLFSGQYKNVSGKIIFDALFLILETRSKEKQG